MPYGSGASVYYASSEDIELEYQLTYNAAFGCSICSSPGTSFGSHQAADIYDTSCPSSARDIYMKQDNYCTVTSDLGMFASPDGGHEICVDDI